MNSKLSALLTSTTEKPRSYAISASASDGCAQPVRAESRRQEHHRRAPWLEPDTSTGSFRPVEGIAALPVCRRRQNSGSRGARKASSSVCTAPVSSLRQGRRRSPVGDLFVAVQGPDDARVVVGIEAARDEELVGRDRVDQLVPGQHVADGEAVGGGVEQGVGNQADRVAQRARPVEREHQEGRGRPAPGAEDLAEVLRRRLDRPPVPGRVPEPGQADRAVDPEARRLGARRAPLRLQQIGGQIARPEQVRAEVAPAVAHEARDHQAVEVAERARDAGDQDVIDGRDGAIDGLQRIGEGGRVDLLGVKGVGARALVRRSSRGGGRRARIRARRPPRDSPPSSSSSPSHPRRARRGRYRIGAPRWQVELDEIDLGDLTASPGRAAREPSWLRRTCRCRVEPSAASRGARPRR